MSFRFEIDHRYRDCKSRFLLAQRIRESFRMPNGHLNWIAKARPDSILHTYIMENEFNVRVYDIPIGTILSPIGMTSPIQEFYRLPVNKQVCEHIRKNARDYRKEKAVCFFVNQTSKGNKPVVRELEYLEFRDPLSQLNLLLEVTCDISSVEDIDFPLYLK